ncbi:genetic competence negative regulator [Paenibacillus chungangensis]|uniref:Genetic competence negative regulator n=1 Tax=Paenibacillus chungangensis TaxID=696535 RepID=A0ABW3HMQ7_9BACL
MKIERISGDRIRIFLTFDDLLERGIQKEDMWREPPKLHELFLEMMEQAYNELGFEASGRPLAVEVYAMPAQGMVVIVTRGKQGSVDDGLRDEDELDDDIYDMEVTMELSDIIMYAFRDFEDVISISTGLMSAGITEGGQLYSYNDKWIMVLEPSQIDSARHNAAIALLAEYGEATSVTYAMLEEYGKVIMAEDAVKTVCDHFNF